MGGPTRPRAITWQRGPGSVREARGARSMSTTRAPRGTRSRSVAAEAAAAAATAHGGLMIAAAQARATQPNRAAAASAAAAAAATAPGGLASGVKVQVQVQAARYGAAAAQALDPVKAARANLCGPAAAAAAATPLVVAWVPVSSVVSSRKSTVDGRREGPIRSITGRHTRSDCTVHMRDAAYVTGCGHVFHRACLDRWRRAKANQGLTCPTCRRGVTWNVGRFPPKRPRPQD